MKEIKLKTSEGCDRIPQSVLLGGLEKMSILFQKIYLQKKIPEQWLMSDKSIIQAQDTVPRSQETLLRMLL